MNWYILAFELTKVTMWDLDYWVNFITYGNKKKTVGCVLYLDFCFLRFPFLWQKFKGQKSLRKIMTKIRWTIDSAAASWIEQNYDKIYDCEFTERPRVWWNTVQIDDFCEFFEILMIWIASFLTHPRVPMGI